MTFIYQVSLGFVYNEKSSFSLSFSINNKENEEQHSLFFIFDLQNKYLERFK